MNKYKYELWIFSSLHDEFILREEYVIKAYNPESAEEAAERYISDEFDYDRFEIRNITLVEKFYNPDGEI